MVTAVVLAMIGVGVQAGSSDLLSYPSISPPEDVRNDTFVFEADVNATKGLQGVSATAWTLLVYDTPTRCLQVTFTKAGAWDVCTWRAHP